MIIRLIYCLVMILCMAVLDSNAKTVIWSVKPVYETMKPYSQGLYLCQLKGKWGVVDADGRTILPNQYDFITSQRNGTGLFGVVEGGKNRLNGIIRSDGTCIPVNGRYYVVANFPYFSEGKLCVFDSSGKQGFMDESGNIVIRCQFDVVRPFREGLSSVKKGAWVYYIRGNYDADPYRNVVYSEWRNGEITEGSSFKNGEAVVGYGNKYRVIDMQGRELRNFSASKWKINPADYTIVYSDADLQNEVELFTPQYSSIEIFSVNGKYGFRLDDEVILHPVLSSASFVDMNQISIAAYNGKTGLLKIIDGTVKFSLLHKGRTADCIPIAANGKSDMLQYAVTLPKQYIGHTRLLVDKGDGNFEDVSSSVTTEGGKLIYGFYPKVGNKDKIKDLKCRLVYEDLEISDGKFTLSVERLARLRLSAPVVTTAQADIKTDIQEVAATVFNDTDSDISVTATLSVDCLLNKSVSHTYNIIIPGKSSKSVGVSVLVETDEDAPAVIRLNTGEQKKSTVSLKTY